MIDTQTLQKAITLAVKNGWKHETVTPWKDGYGVQKLKSIEHLKEFDVEHIIFNHDFAKALWGDEPYYRFDGDTIDTPKTWQYHLQQLVIAPDPIKYLEEHIDG